MSRYYRRKGAGRYNPNERSLMGEIDDVLAENDLLESDIRVVESEGDLEKLKDELVAKYESSQSEPAEEAPAEEAPAEEAPAEEAPAEPSTSELDNTDLTDFVEKKTQSAFSAGFKPEDMHKLNLDRGQSSSAEEILSTSEPAPASSSSIVKPAWEMQKNISTKSKMSSRLDSFDDDGDSTPAPKDDGKTVTPASTEKPKPLSPEDEKKVKLAKSASRKATKSLAKQSAKIFEWVLEWAVKKFSKISDKSIDKMEKSGDFSRHMPMAGMAGKTIAQFIDDHNDEIDEIVKVDEDDRDDLIEAIMLVAEEEDVKASPKANLAMVVLTMGMSMAKAAYDEKKDTKKAIKKSAEAYTIGVEKLGKAESEIVELKRQLSFKQDSSSPAPVVKGVQEVPIRQLSFTKNIPSKPAIEFGKPDHTPVRNFPQADSMVEEVNSEVAGEETARQAEVKKKEESEK